MEMILLRFKVIIYHPIYICIGKAPEKKKVEKLMPTNMDSSKYDSVKNQKDFNGFDPK